MDERGLKVDLCKTCKDDASGEEQTVWKADGKGLESDGVAPWLGDPGKWIR